MNRDKTITQINLIILDLNGLPIKEEDTINKSRLQIYAIIVLFYKLNTLWRCFDITYAYKAIYNCYTFKDIVNKVAMYETSKKI